METFNTILKEDVREKIFVECSTITPEATNELARRVLNAGGEFVAMPGKIMIW
jgi:3-hydroxyisobutyrate dehydrogenase-like beta-hydroxyacid dehydrogenase